MSEALTELMDVEYGCIYTYMDEDGLEHNVFGSLDRNIFDEYE